jgi:branched-chain amino acid transport system ATP-binding protein
MLDVKNIQVYHGKVQVIKGISLHVNEREMVFMIGPNGSGKTTCLHTICGVCRASAGTIIFCGEHIERIKRHVVPRKGIGLIPQGRRVFSDQNIMDNLRLGYLCRSGDKDFNTVAEFVFDLFPVLKDRRHQLAGTLSGGEQQMLAIGRSIMAKPKLLLCDELSLGLAPLVVELVFDSLLKLQGLETAMLIVEQMATKVFEVASRGYVLTLGKIILEGNTETMTKDERIKKAYLSE